jgi:ketosteroid isomerase-like protein
LPSANQVGVASCLGALAGSARISEDAQSTAADQVSGGKPRIFPLSEIPMRIGLWFGLLLCSALATAADPPDKAKQIGQVLDDWHQAAATAKLDRYFGHFTADAVFFGTDATERWSRDEFRRYAKPHFDKGKAWTFKATRRNVAFAKDGATAWFDETLETAHLGPARGTGVMVLDGGSWKIAQYHLCVPIPNEVFDQVKKIIEKAPKGKE